MRNYKNLPHRKHYVNAVVRSSFFALSILVFSMFIGTWGYCHFYNLGLVDGMLNASMILTGMGPIDTAPTDGAKLFATFYALYSGVAFLTSVAVIFGPVLHRFLHRFHLDVEE
jgi:hypothetical protein